MRQYDWMQRATIRPFLLFVLGAIAGLTEYGIRLAAMDGLESIYMARMAHGAVIGLGMAFLAGVPRQRMRIAFTWSLLAGFVSVSFYILNPLFGRILFGTFLGFAMVAAGPVRPIPWLCLLRGALGACLGSIAAHYAAANGAPSWTWPAIGATVLGTVLTPSLGERMRAILANEIEAAHFTGSRDIGRRADAAVQLAVKTIEDMEDRRERSGMDQELDDDDVIRTTAHLLTLMQRYATIPPRAEQMKETLLAHIEWSENRLADHYCSELGALMKTSGGNLAPHAMETGRL